MAFTRFLIVGGLGFVIDSGMTLVLIHLGLSAFIARLPAIFSAMAFTWLANRRITFCLDTEATREEAIRYFSVAITMAGFNYFLFFVLVKLSLPAFLAITFATAIQTVLSYYGYKLFAFRQHQGRAAIQGVSSSPAVSIKTLRTALWIVALVLFIVNFVFKYPGEFNNDSSNQYAQALSGQYGDWHPPIMAWLWSWLLHIVDGPSTILALHLVLHWFGFALIADALLCLGQPRTAWLALLSGAFPVFLFYNGLITKDVGMASAMLVAFGLGFRYRIIGQPVPLPVLLLAALLLAYGTLVRTNAIFAFGPLFIYLFADRARLISIKQLALVSIVLAGLALPLSNYINHDLLSAKRDDSIQSLFLFDLNGIAYHSGDLNVLPPEFAFSKDDLQHCYTPYWWDTLSPWGGCGFAWERLGPENSLARKNLGYRWLTEIVKHPLSYTVHRLKVLNSMLYFLVPAKHCRYALDCGPKDPITHNRRPTTTDQEIRLDYIKKSPLVWPINWMVFGLVLLGYTNRIKSPETLSATRALLLSGISVLSFMILVGVATDMRYAYWSIMSILLAALISFGELRPYLQRSDPVVISGGALLVLTGLAGLLSRLFNFTALVG
ncbi:MAG: GtrA family protein [Methylobacter sp.]